MTDEVDTSGALLCAGQIPKLPEGSHIMCSNTSSAHLNNHETGRRRTYFIGSGKINKCLVQITSVLPEFGSKESLLELNMQLFIYCGKGIIRHPAISF